MAIRATISVQSIQAQTTTELVQAQTEYQLSVASEIWTDPDSKNRILFDEYLLADAHFYVLQKILTETISVPDLYSNAFSTIKADAISIADTFINEVSYRRTFNDAFTLDDLSQIDKDFYGNKGNIFAFTDIVGLTHNKKLTDSYTISDVIANVISFKRNFNDSTSLSDANILDTVKVSTDSISFTEIQAKATLKDTTDSFNMGDTPYIGSEPNKADSFSLSELYLNAITKHVTDTFVLDDALQVDKDYFGNKGNIFSFSDIFSRVLEYKRSFVDPLTFTESTSTDIFKKIADNFIVYDENLMNGSLGSNVMNSKQLNGKAKAYLGARAATIHNELQTNPDTLTFAELSAMVYAKALADITTLSDSNTISNTKSRADSISVGDAHINVFSMLKADVFTMQEALGKNTNKDSADSFNIHDILGTTFNKVVTDAFALDDSALVDKDFYGNKGNIVAMNDVVTVTRVARRLVNGASFNRTQLN
jgi:hypothetical protein